MIDEYYVPPIDPGRVKAVTKLIHSKFHSDRPIFWSPQSFETTLDTSRVKAGVVVAYNSLEADISKLSIWRAGLRLIWKSKRKGELYDGKGIKDDTWNEDARSFSNHYRRGVKEASIEIIDVSRDHYQARRYGYNDVFIVRFSE